MSACGVVGVVGVGAVEVVAVVVVGGGEGGGGAGSVPVVSVRLGRRAGGGLRLLLPSPSRSSPSASSRCRSTRSWSRKPCWLLLGDGHCVGPALVLVEPPLPPPQPAASRALPSAARASVCTGDGRIGRWFPSVGRGRGWCAARGVARCRGGQPGRPSQPSPDHYSSSRRASASRAGAGERREAAPGGAQERPPVLAGGVLLEGHRVAVAQVPEFVAQPLACTDCKRRNYQTNKSKRNTPDRMELAKFCPTCGKHTAHRETR